MPLLTLLLVAFSDPHSVHNTTETLREFEAELQDPRDCTVRIPQNLIRGDREFDGGPLVTFMGCAQIGEDRRSLSMHLYMRAEETKGDHTTVEENWTIEGIRLQLPEGMCIARLLDPACSFMQFRAKDAGFQILGPTGDVKPLIAAGLNLAGLPEDGIERLLDELGDGAPDTETREFDGTGLLAGIEMVVDTGGDDVSDDDNEHDDMHIKCLEFNPSVRVALEPCE